MFKKFCLGFSLISILWSIFIDLIDCGTILQFEDYYVMS